MNIFTLESIVEKHFNRIKKEISSLVIPKNPDLILIVNLDKTRISFKLYHKSFREYNNISIHLDLKSEHFYLENRADSFDEYNLPNKEDFDIADLFEQLIQNKHNVLLLLKESIELNPSFGS